MQPFIHLHVHSQYSILDGQASIPALVDKAIRDGMKGLALTDHGNMFGIKEFFNLVKKKNGATKDAIKGVQKRIEAIESGAEEAEDKEKLMHFYEDENGFKQFDVRETKCSDNDEIHKLVQLLKVM